MSMASRLGSGFDQLSKKRQGDRQFAARRYHCGSGHFCRRWICPGDASLRVSSCEN
jgi:hypothetical protein